MQITLSQVLPRPLADSPLVQGSVWKSECTINSSESLFVQAPSGTGKTTLVSLLYGLRSDYEGTISIDGTDIRRISLNGWAELRRLKISAVFQDLRLFGQLTALENIHLKNNLTGALTPDEIAGMAKALGVDHRLNQSCGTLSLGQQQRIAVIRALAQPFELLLLDEPFSHLDDNNAAIAANLVTEHCARRNAGLVLTSLGGSAHFSFTRQLII
ncbi:MAG: ATP-binding cassette domain-containing protein [Bacteroidia bacterium]|jgi:ABC-type lipoprotein export system ATPase subunit|nr:ATP-binding cassette domain-containing protein [Bacteroidia bacterium]